MFTYIYLKNFKSFGEIRFDFKKSKTKPETKKFVAIYGENGSGKSNFMSVFELLQFSINAFKLAKMTDSLTNNFEEFIQYIPKIDIQNILRTISFKYSDYRMIGCNSATTVEIGFLENNIEGHYRLVFKDKIISEELYYLCGKKRGLLFSLDSDKNKREISKTLFSLEYLKDFEKELDKYWSMYTFLGVLVKEIESKNRSYIEANISKNLLDACSALNCYFAMFSHNRMTTNFGHFNKDNPHYQGMQYEKSLAQKERILNALLCELYSDIKEVYYEKRIMEDGSLPPLHVKKVIAGKVRDVLFDYESFGTKRIIDIVDAMIAVMNGYTVICDEIDTGIHDLLMKSILTSLAENASGQLIITTHNTLLLESIDPQSAYVIYVDCDGNKEARCFADYEGRIQKTNNMRNLYLKGMYGGIPYASEIDFSFLINKAESDGDACG